jgi:uncharacterized repeat protein (TIGR01451 family)
VVLVTADADLSLTKTLVEPNPVTAGARVVYELVAANAGPSLARNVILADPVPDGLEFVSGAVVGSGEVCTLTEGTSGEDVVNCAVESVAVGDTVTARLTFKVADDYTGALCNTAEVGSGAGDPDTTNNSDEACGEVVVPDPTDVGVKVTPGQTEVDPGADVSYTVVVTNNGPNPATGAEVVITVPPDMTDVVVVVTDHKGAVTPVDCTAVDNVYTCYIGDMEVGDSVTYEITGKAPATGPGNLVLEAETSHGGIDTVPENDKDSGAIKVKPSPTRDPRTPPPATGGTTPVTPGPGKLDYTGADSTSPMLMAGMLVLFGGALVAAAWRYRRRPRVDED